MVCIAAFIILVLVGVFVAVISIFKRDFGKKYWKVLKKAFHCFGKKVRLQKCDTNFSDDVKSLLLKKVVLKKPKLVKPLSISIEVASVLLVIITAWSIIEAAKAGLSLWVFGTCNVSQPSNCALGADSCGLDEDNLNWFTEWGEIFNNIPDRIKWWDASKFGLTPAFTLNNESNNVAVELIDPGCSVCLQSYKNLLKDQSFLSSHQTRVVLYPIKNTNGELRFKNSEIIARYIISTNLVMEMDDYAEYIIDRIFTQFNIDGVIYQEVFNNQLNSEEAVDLLGDWLKEWGVSLENIVLIEDLMDDDAVSEIMDTNRKIVDEEIRPKGIPTFIYEGKKHLGLFK